MLKTLKGKLMDLKLFGWPSCILHLDADAFFVSVEQALNPSLKGKPVSVGAERGIVATASYEARARGVKTAMKLTDAKRLCPNLISLPSDYESYSIFSKRMFAIMRRYTPVVEEYSLDEGFADLSGLRRFHHASYGEIARRIQEAVESELGITVSVGVSLSKPLAKIASEFKKPSGFMVVPGRELTSVLDQTPLKAVWGFGPNTVALLQKHGLKTALDFIRKPESFAKEMLGKIGTEMHQELSGKLVHAVNPAEKTSYASISKVKTFTPPSKDADFIFGQALRNLEGACIKARRYSLGIGKLYLFLRQQDFTDEGIEIPVARPTSSPLDLSVSLKDAFKKIYRPNAFYRSTGVVLRNLEPIKELQLDLFEGAERAIKTEKAAECIDIINTKYGKHKIHLAPSIHAHRRHEGNRAALPDRRNHSLPGETFRQRLGIPLLRQKTS